MQYMLMIYQNEAAYKAMQGKPEGKEFQAAYGAYTQALIKAGVLKAGDQLKDTSAATTVRIDGGKTKVLDGPYAESKEQLAGYYILDVADADAALSWAAKCPGAAFGAIEVRPIIMMS